MPLALSPILAEIKKFTLSKLKICNAVLLALLSNIVLLSSNDAYGYTVYRSVWTGTNTTYSKNSNLSSYAFYGAAVDAAANNWNASSSPFEFALNSSSSNNVKMETIAVNRYAETALSNSGNNWTQFTMKINTNPPNPFYVGSGTPASNQIDLLSVLQHEFGHVLGLAHTIANNNLMSFNLQLGQTYSVDNDAIDGSRYLYDSAYNGFPPERSAATLTTPPYSGSGTYDDQSSAISYGGRADSWSSISGVTNAGFSTISCENLAA